MATDTNNQNSDTSRPMESDISEEAMKERRYLWMARAFALVAVVSFLANLLLLSAIFSLTPIVRIQPFYLSTQDKDEQIISVVRPNNLDIDGKILAESFIRQYLLARLTIGTNIPTLENTWGIDGIVAWESEPTVFRGFTETSLALIEQAKKEGLTRNVHILNVIQLSREPNGSEIWQAEIMLSDMKQGISKPMESKWLVTMQIAFLPVRQGLKWEQRLKNPLGFTVQKFGIQAIQ